MDNDLKKITAFIKKHHVLSLATHDLDDLSVCSLFYVYIEDVKSFIVASSDETNHIRHIKKNPKVAGNILLETKTVSNIQGLQFKGEFLTLQEKYKEFYFKKFPYSKVMKPKLWQVKVDYFKFTDNTLGFGKKLIWQDSVGYILAEMK